MKAPKRCPICGKSDTWELISIKRKNFNLKNAVIGTVFLGDAGFFAGLSGKQIYKYKCSQCGFSHKYGHLSNKDSQSSLLKGYKNKGFGSAYIDILTRATPNCVFCNKPQKLYIKQDGGAFRFLCPFCYSEFKCEFSFTGQVKAKTVHIIDCGTINKDNLNVGPCDPSLLIHNKTIIKE